jgi:hypothetical protein
MSAPLWSEVIRTLQTEEEPDRDLRFCADGGEHRMRGLGPNAICDGCGLRVYGWRPCRKCGQPFRPARSTYYVCPDCFHWEPPATEKQLRYLSILASLLGVRPAAPRTFADAARAIDELILLAEADPNVTRCAEDGCDFLIDARGDPRCWRHRKGRKS